MEKTDTQTREQKDRYLEQLKHAKVKGYLWEQQNYGPKA